MSEDTPVNIGVSWPEEYEAGALVRKMQVKLHHWAEADRSRRFHDLFNLVCDRAFLTVAWQRVSTNAGARTPGVDRATVSYIVNRVGAHVFLGHIRELLKSGQFRPVEVRQVMIPKASGKLRKLGIPTVTDRVVQAALKLVLEPIFEADFLPVSYGFRPGRACRDALEHIRNAIRPTGVKTETDWPRPPYQWVIEGDIKGCFDNIDHHHVLTRLRRRVADTKVCRLVRGFLKAGVLSEDAFLRTDTGTPQGGVLSPLLANITLSAIEERYATYVAPRRTRDGAAYARPGDAVRKFRHYERKAGRPVFLPIRYADDFVVLVAGNEDQARIEKEDLAAFLADELKLTLSPEKTRVTALPEGFIFLGHRVRLRWDDRWGYWPRLEIPKDRIADLRRRIKHLTTRARRNLPLGAVIDELNPLLLGWGRFYRHCHGAKAVFSRTDHYVWDRLWRWLRKKYPDTSRRAIYRRYWRKLPDRQRHQWTDHRPVAIVADLKVERHSLKGMRSPDYIWPGPESPVHNERCTPGPGTGGGETGGSNPAEAPCPHVHLKSQRSAA
jgi:RNA-directed DNA polymerase